MGKYKLELTEDQAKIISAACDLYCRIRLGQFDEIISHTLEERIAEIGVDKFCQKRDEANIYLLQARQIIFDGLTNTLNHSYGIGQDKNAEIAWNVHQVLRHVVKGDDRVPYSIYQPLPKCDRIEENLLSRSENTKPDNSLIGLWVVYYKTGMNCNQHGKIVEVTPYNYVVKKKKGRRMDYIEDRDIIALFKNKKDCYEK